MHNPYNANVKVSRSEMAQVGRMMAERLNEAKGPTAVLIPLQGMVRLRRPRGALFMTALGNRIFLEGPEGPPPDRISDRRRSTPISMTICLSTRCVDQLIDFMDEERS